MTTELNGKKPGNLSELLEQAKAESYAAGRASLTSDAERDRLAVERYKEAQARETALIAQYREEGRNKALAEVAEANKKAAEEAAQKAVAEQQAAEQARQARISASDKLLDLEVAKAVQAGQYDQFTQLAGATKDRGEAVQAAHNAGIAQSQADFVGRKIKEVATKSGDNDIKAHYGLVAGDEPARVPAPEGFTLKVVPDEHPLPKKVEPAQAPAQAPKRRLFGR